MYVQKFLITIKPFSNLTPTRPASVGIITAKPDQFMEKDNWEWIQNCATLSKFTATANHHTVKINVIF